MVEPSLRKQAIPMGPAPFVVHHYGELADSDRRAKQLRYYRMGVAKLAEHPDNVSAMIELAIQAGELGLFSEALEMWDKLLERGVATRDVYFNRSYILMGLKRFGEASEMALKALEIDPGHKESAYNHAMCQFNLARAEQALPLVEKLVQEQADYPLPLALLCVLYLCTGREDSATAIFRRLESEKYSIADYIRERHAGVAQLGHLAFAERLANAAAAIGIQTN